MLAAGATAVLVALPVLARRIRAPAAVVSASNCNGCGRCLADCPYAAITLEPRSTAGQKVAVVATDLCASCGVCAGACPSSTPFRSTDALVTGIDMPDRPVAALRDALEGALRGALPRESIVVFGCDEAADIRTLADARTIPISLRCTGALPPSFVEYALRSGALGVLVTGCPPGECAYRLGARLTEDRLAGRRLPRLRANVPSERVRLACAGRGEDAKLHTALAQFRAALAHAKRQTLPIATRARKAGARV
jgi:ferredoxin/coenzyme F420-reducing hydrogenase delta subunit